VSHSKQSVRLTDPARRALIAAIGAPRLAKNGSADKDFPSRLRVYAFALLHRIGRTITALKLWRPLADQGDAQAQNAMGQMYL
jgi:TPR repeat protein